MKKFRFTLQAVLTLRQRAEQAALESYGRALRARAAAQPPLAEVAAELPAVWALWRAQLDGGCPAAEAAQTRSYCGALEERKTKCEAALHLAERELDAASRTLLKARQGREAVEQLQSAQHERHARALRLEERKEIDDLVNRRLPQVLADDLSQNRN